MLFNAIRIILWLFICALTILIIRKTKIIRKRLLVGLIVTFCLGLITASAMFPIENLFINFPSPESVFHYTRLGRIESVTYGDDSCMVFYSNENSTYLHTFVLKAKNGYKIAGYFSAKKVADRFDKDAMTNVYRIVGTRDYYVIGSVNLEGSEIDLFDGDNKQIRSSIQRSRDGDLIYFFLRDFTNKHYLLVDGKKVLIAK